MKGWLIFLGLCAWVAGLSLLAPDTARWFAIGFVVALIYVASALPRRYAAPKQDGEASKAAKGTGS